MRKYSTKQYFQLQQPEVNGQEYGRRFRIENGDSPGEKDEVRKHVWSYQVAISLESPKPNRHRVYRR